MPSHPRIRARVKEPSTVDVHGLDGRVVVLSRACRARASLEVGRVARLFLGLTLQKAISTVLVGLNTSLALRVEIGMGISSRMDARSSVDAPPVYKSPTWSAYQTGCGVRRTTRPRATRSSERCGSLLSILLQVDDVRRRLTWWSAQAAAER